MGTESLACKGVTNGEHAAVLLGRPELPLPLKGRPIELPFGPHLVGRALVERLLGQE